MSLGPIRLQRNVASADLAVIKTTPKVREGAGGEEKEGGTIKDVGAGRKQTREGGGRAGATGRIPRVADAFR